MIVATMIIIMLLLIMYLICKVGMIDDQVHRLALVQVGQISMNQHTMFVFIYLKTTRGTSWPEGLTYSKFKMKFEN